MPYQGNTPVESYIATVKDSFNGNGSTTAFTMSKPTQVNDVRVVVENVIQDPSVAYTVSGTTITFTSAPPSGTNNIYVIHLGPAVATAQPPAEIADATTFASNVSVQGSFTSPGIDDNADATALTIDSSEVVLVGKTSNTFSQQGVALRANNDSQITRDGGNPLSLNRTSSDGDIAKFFKDGSTVGNIGTFGGTTYFSSNTHAIMINGTAITPSLNTGNRVDGAMDLGASGYRFKDAYLSGGIYLGGAVAANKLDDYEEGTFTPTVTVGTLGDAAGAYTKIGNTVIAYMYMGAFSNRSSGSILTINNLPFTSANALANGAGGSIFSRHCNKLPNATYISNNSTNVEMYESATGNYDTVKHADLSSVSAYFFIQVIYKTS